MDPELRAKRLANGRKHKADNADRERASSRERKRKHRAEHPGADTGGRNERRRKWRAKNPGLCRDRKRNEYAAKRLNAKLGAPLPDAKAIDWGDIELEDES